MYYFLFISKIVLLVPYPLYFDIRIHFSALICAD